MINFGVTERKRRNYLEGKTVYKNPRRVNLRANYCLNDKRDWTFVEEGGELPDTRP